ncbi:MAG TPA: efflux RND transporter periplasmic adaptor subunit [Pirellulales bacterium]
MSYMAIDCDNSTPANLSARATNLLLAGGFVMLLAGLATSTGCNRKAAGPPPVKIQQVMYTTPVEEVVSEYEEFTGRTAAMKTVEIRARVSGYLDKVNFADGAEVKIGDLLFQIDPRWFKASADQAAANVSQYESRIERLDRQVTRATPLIENHVKSQEEFDQYTFDHAEAKSTLKGMQAAKELADLNLSYTRVLSPIDGRISRRMVDPGNLVRADETVLTTIVSIHPIYAYFDIDERTVLRLRRLVRDGRIKSHRETEITVQVALSDEDQFNLSGVVDFVDNQVDPTTGTLRLRAVIQNPNRLLSPGLFVRIRFPIGDPHPALLIPEEALATDQGQRFVYVIDDKNHVVYRRVQVGMLLGGKRVITQGLAPEDRIAVSGLQRLRKDLEVDPRPLNGGPSANASLPPAGSSGAPVAGVAAPPAGGANPPPTEGANPPPATIVETKAASAPPPPTAPTAR